MTLKEIAAMAGVSPAAVSRFLNGGSLSSEKSEKIREVIEQTGFRPNTLARSLRKGLAKQVGVLVPKIHSTSMSEVLAGIESILSENGYLTLLCCTDGDVKKEEEYLLQFRSLQLAGLIIMACGADPVREELYLEAGVPLVVTGQSFERLDCVFHDDYHAMYALAEIMIKAGRKQIAYIGVDHSDHAVGEERSRGAREALRDAGLDADRMPEEFSDFSISGGYKAMKALFAKGLRPDGVLCATDSMAQGALQAAKEAGLRVPQDISVAGIGNDDANEISEPKLTTIKLYQFECGRQAAIMLLDRIEKEENAQILPRKTMLSYTLRERGSI